MRQIFDNQMQFGEVDISKIQPNIKSRDDIDKALFGLKHIYTTPELRENIFKVLGKITPKVSKTTGRPGMDLWKIFVMGVLRQVCKYDYDRLLDTVNNHRSIRLMLGHNSHVEWGDNCNTYELQTLKDNVTLLTPEILDEINDIVVNAGHKQLSKKKWF